MGAGFWEGDEVFCSEQRVKGWLRERRSWRRRLGGAGFPAIVGEIFLLCFSCDRLAVADVGYRITGTVVAATACPSWAAGAFLEGQRGPHLRSNVSARRCRAGSSGGYAAGWLLGGLKPICMCRLAIASNLGSIYNEFSSRKGGAEVFSVAVMNYLFGTENSRKKRNVF